MKKILFVLQVIVAIILLQTLWFKFTAAPESVYIFETIGMEPFGRIGIGVMELIASVLILLPKTRAIGAVLAAGLMSGALFFHLTSLGIEVQGDSSLFYLALTVFVLSAFLAFFYRKELPLVGQYFG